MINPYLTWTGIEVDGIKSDCHNLLDYYFEQLSLLSKDKTVLDIGCGAGHLGLKSKQFGANKVFALDNNPILLESLRKTKNLLSYDWLEIISMDAMDLPNGVDEPDIVIIGDNLPRNLLQNMWHLKLMELAIAWPNVKIIPNKITLTGKIVTSHHLDEIINWKYGQFDDFLDSVVLNCMKNSPMTLSKQPDYIMTESEETILTLFDYDNRRIECGNMEFNKSDSRRWLQLTMHLGNDQRIYKFDRQINFIPLDTTTTSVKMFVDKRHLSNTLVFK